MYPRRKTIIIISIVIFVLGSILLLRENFIRRYQGGAFFLRDIPSGVGTKPVINHTYGFHSAIWQVFYQQPEGYRLFDLASEVGAPYMRVGLNRRWIEPREGEYHWDTVQGAVDKAAERGIKIVPSIYHGNGFWASKPTTRTKAFDSRLSEVPIDLSADWNETYGYSKSIYTFYQALLTKYPNTFPYIAIGNEPNAETFWDGTYEEFVRLLQTAAKAIHDTDPSVKVIDGGIASEAWACIGYDSLKTGRWTEAQTVDFVRGIYEASRYHKEISEASDEKLVEFIRTDPKIVEECTSREAYFQGLVGHVDAVNFHYYEHLAYLDEVIDYLDEKMQQYGWQDPVIVTNELGNKEFNNPSYDVEGEDQAQDLRAKLEYVTDRGLPLVIWFSVNGDDSETGGFLSTHAKDGTPYEAAREYRRFLEEQAAK